MKNDSLKCKITLELQKLSSVIPAKAGIQA